MVIVHKGLYRVAGANAGEGVMTKDDVALVAGVASTTLFVVSYLPMLYRASEDPGSGLVQPAQPGPGQRRQCRPGDLRLQPAGRTDLVPARLLPGASALMLALHYRHTHRSAGLPARTASADRGDDRGDPCEWNHTTKEVAMTATTADRRETELLQGLRARLCGVAHPGDDGYDAARSTWNRNADHRPAFIVMAENAEDIRSRCGTRGDRARRRRAGHRTRHRDALRGGLLIDTRGCARSGSTRPADRHGRGGRGVADVVAAAAVLDSPVCPDRAPPSASSATPSAAGSAGSVAGTGWRPIPSPGPRSSRRPATHHRDADERPGAVLGTAGRYRQPGRRDRAGVRLYPVAEVYAGNLYYPLTGPGTSSDFFAEWSGRHRRS